MRSLILALAALAIGLTACGGGQPRTYKVAINQTSLSALPSTCYRSGSTPQDTVAITNGFADTEWTLWDGTDKQYLDIGSNTWVLGQANPVTTGPSANSNPSASTLPSLIEGSQKTFSVQRVLTKASVSPTEVDTRTVTVTFDDVPGDTMKGNIAVNSSYSCGSGCTQPSCQATLPFVGRRINAQPNVNYSGQ